MSCIITNRIIASIVQGLGCASMKVQEGRFWSKAFGGSRNYLDKGTSEMHHDYKGHFLPTLMLFDKCPPSSISMFASTNISAKVLK